MTRAHTILLSLAMALLAGASVTEVSGQTDPTYREKAFVHADRGSYLTGETLWFSLYCTDASTHRPSPLSKVGYVELTGPGANATVHTKIVLSNGNGNGYLNLPASLPSGNYVLRAWTQWMRNFPEEGCHTVTITVINPAKRPEPAKAVKPEAPLAGFYPEGGHAVEGVEGLVACHVTDAQGNGLAVNAVLIKNGADTLSRFTTDRRGFGSFTLRPEPDVNYTVALGSPGAPAVYPLPAANRSGHAFSVRSKDGQEYTIQAMPSADLPRERMTLVLMKDRQVVRTWEAKTDAGPLTWTISHNTLPEGMSRLVLFNQAGEPVAERSVFRKPTAALLSLKAMADQSLVGNRKPVTLAMESLDSKQKPAPSTLSVAVYKMDSLESRPVPRMAEWLWLGSALRGRVEDPGYYLSDSATAAATDLLMLTQGWTRFKWSDTAAPVLRYAPEYAGHLITGTVSRRSDGTPLKGIPAFLSVQGKRFHFGSATSDGAGRVAFDLKKIYGNGSLILQTGVDSTAHIELDDPWKHPFPKATPAPLLFTPDMGNTLRKAVLYNRAGTRPPAAERFYFPDATDSLPFFGQAEKTYLLDDYTRFRTMDEIFREFIPEVQVKRPRGNYELRVDHAPLPEFFSTDPLMLLDGAPYFNTNEVMNFDPLKIRKIDIVNRHYYQGSQDYSGIISMVTYDGDGGGMALNPNAVLVEYEGLQLRREFPATEYRTPEQLSSHQPDFRRLLHWAPSIWTGEKGKADLRFYTGDDKGKYLIVVQGLSDDGLAGTTITSFEVK